MFEDLFEGSRPGRKWVDGVSDDCRQFLSDLADEIVRRGKEPSWSAALRHIEREWPDDAPRGTESVSRVVRSLVKERG